MCISLVGRRPWYGGRCDPASGWGCGGCVVCRYPFTLLVTGDGVWRRLTAWRSLRPLGTRHSATPRGAGTGDPATRRHSILPRRNLEKPPRIRKRSGAKKKNTCSSSFIFWDLIRFYFIGISNNFLIIFIEKRGCVLLVIYIQRNGSVSEMNGT